MGKAKEKTNNQEEFVDDNSKAEKSESAKPAKTNMTPPPSSAGKTAAAKTGQPKPKSKPRTSPAADDNVLVHLRKISIELAGMKGELGTLKGKMNQYEQECQDYEYYDDDEQAYCYAEHDEYDYEPQPKRARSDDITQASAAACASESASDSMVSEPSNENKNKTVPDGKFTAAIQRFSKEQEKTGENLEDSLAVLVDSVFAHGVDYDEFKNMTDSVDRPGNTTFITPVKVNTLIWRLLSEPTKKLDERIQVIQKAMAKAGICMARMLHLLSFNEEQIDKELYGSLNKHGTDGLAILGHGFHNLCMRRRELMKPDLSGQYANLCAAEVPHTQWLFGDDVQATVKEIGTTNQVAGKLRPGMFGSRARGRGRGRGFPYNQHGFRGGYHGGFFGRPNQNQRHQTPTVRGVRRRGGFSGMKGGKAASSSATMRGEPNRPSASEASQRRGSGSMHSSSMANAAVVYNVSRTVGQKSHTTSKKSKTSHIEVQPQTASTTQKIDTDSRSLVGKALGKFSVSARATEIIQHAWKSGTQKQYAVYIRKWTQFCAERKCDYVTPDVGLVLDFLAHLYDQGQGYSAINTARSALSQFILWNEHQTIGSHPWVIKFLRAVYNLRPTVPRYVDTWDVSALLTVLRKLSPNRKLTLKDLTFKTVVLIALLLSARSQTITLLRLDNMTKHKAKFCFTVGASELKQSRPGYSPPLIELNAYPVDRSLCVYRALEEYIKRTEDLRGEESVLFISFVKPHKKVHTSTIARWIKTIMIRAGIDVLVYRPHSIRAAAASKMWQSGGTLQEIMATAGWSNAGTFAKFYNKNIVKESQMARKVLGE